MKNRFAIGGSFAFAAATAAGLLLATSQAGGGGRAAAPRRTYPELSFVALSSGFAKANHLGGAQRASVSAAPDVERQNAAGAKQVNTDWNQRPQDETTIAVNPTDPRQWVIGANDYGVGPPYNGVYTSDGVNYLTPVPTLAMMKGENLFTETAGSGSVLTGLPGSPGFGTLQQGYLETSNVNAVQEITDLITAQRAYEMNSKVISAADQMLQITSKMS